MEIKRKGILITYHGTVSHDTIGKFGGFHPEVKIRAILFTTKIVPLAKLTCFRFPSPKYFPGIALVTFSMGHPV